MISLQPYVMIRNVINSQLAYSLIDLIKTSFNYAKDIFHLLRIFILRFCLCNFESDTVKNDCPIQIFMKIMKYLKDC